VGRLLLGARARVGRQGALLAFLVGGILVLVVEVIPVLGPIVMAVAVCLGFGAILLQTLAVRREARALASVPTLVITKVVHVPSQLLSRGLIASSCRRCRASNRSDSR